MRSVLASPLAAIVLALVAACSSSGDDAVERGPIDKADVLGSCSGACGDIATAGDCYCDDACLEIGDCCADRVEECVAAAPRACAGPLFDAHPIDGAMVIEESGVKLPMPSAVCGADVTYVYGLADRAPVAALLEGTGQAPLAFPGDRTLVRLSFTDYPSTDLGAYREVGVILATLPAATPAPEAVLVNDYSLVAAALTPGTVSFLGPLVVDGEVGLALAYGKVLGLDKHVGEISVASSAEGQLDHGVSDDAGQLIAQLSIQEDASPTAQYAELSLLAAAFGLPGPEAFPPPAAETRFAIANQRIDAPATVEEWSATYGPLAGIFHRFDAAQDALALGDGSEVGGWLGAVHFEPRLSVHYPSLDIVLED